MDCIYEGDRSLYVNPDECVDCGACKLICRVDAIYYETDLPDDQQQHLADNAAFFSQVLPGRDAPLGSPRRCGDPRAGRSRHSARREHAAEGEPTFGVIGDVSWPVSPHD